MTTKPTTRSVELAPAELYQMHRTIVALEELEAMLRRRWGARCATVLLLDAVGQDLDDTFKSESSAPERAVMDKYFMAESVGTRMAQRGAAKEMAALPKPG